MDLLKSTFKTTLFAGLGLAAFLALPHLTIGEETATETPPDPLAAHGYSVTTGAAPGYVDDRACASCHHAIYESYQEVGMAKSFYRPRPENAIEDFENNRLHHTASNRYYEMYWEDDKLVFRRFMAEEDGTPYNLYEQEVDWIMGSGHTSRVYLFRTPAGELYQLPIAWYSQTQSWGMAPGFDRPDHLGLIRRVRRECMFCHNAYPDVPEGSDGYAAPHLFPAELPEGIGCQRCHGPGAEHARLAMADEVDFKAVAASIVDPGELTPELRDSVCFGCHLQPSVALPGVRRFGRDDYSFRPGEPLSDYLVTIEIEERRRARWERFEINHHPYRLRQSVCYLESEPGVLSCLTCHDPHRKVPAEKRAEHYRTACLGCHQLDALTAKVGDDETAHTESGDCVACHMPRTRTQDVVQVVMTDHLIQRKPGGEELLAPLRERDPDLVGVELYDPPRELKGLEGEIYRAAAVVRATKGTSRAAVFHLGKTLFQLETTATEPWLDLAEGLLKQREFLTAREIMDDLLEREGEILGARERRAIALVGLGEAEEAIAELRGILEKDPDAIEARFNLGRILLGYGEAEKALPELERAVELRPNFAAAWHYLGEARAELDQPEAAIEAHTRALAIDPDYDKAVDALRELRRGP